MGWVGATVSRNGRNLLNLLARGSFGNEALAGFNQAWGAADSRDKANMLEEVLEEEADGWLDTPAARAKLRPLE
jgi:hypothetical protein